MKKLILIVLLLCLAGSIFWDEDILGTDPSETAAAEPVTEAPEERAVYVYVTGAVRKPGLYSFPGTVRIGEAVQSAGGAVPYADTAAINYAGEAGDGTHVHIPYNLEGIPAGSDEANGLININEADEKKLTELPGIGPAMAQRIMDYRNEHGAFKDCGELQQVKGIGVAKYKTIKDKVTV